MDIRRNHLFNTNKLEYIKDRKKKQKCILCSIVKKSPEVTVLEIYRTQNFIVAANLYPYNPGHVMIFPVKHMENIQELTDDEALEMHKLTAKIVTILQEEYHPSGFNIGFNLGNCSGASLRHIHQHIVPRFDNETGFIDILAGTRIFVVDPVETMERLKKKLKIKKFVR